MQLTKEQLRQAIKDKFGTISRFILESGLPAKKVRSSLHRDIPSAVAYRRVIQKDVTDLTPEVIKGVDLTDDDRENIRVAIYTQYKSAADFYTEYPEFTPTFISNVINGGRKKQDKRVKYLMEVLKVGK